MKRYNIEFDEGALGADTMKQVMDKLETLEAETHVVVKDTKQHKIIRKGEADVIRKSIQGSFWRHKERGNNDGA